MAAKLFVGNLSWDTTNQSLSDFFSQAGTVVSATVITDKFTGKSRGFAFVEMSTDEEAAKARELNGQTLDNRQISVNDARPQQPRDNSSGGGFDRRGDHGGHDDRRGGGGRSFRR